MDECYRPIRQNKLGQHFNALGGPVTPRLTSEGPREATCAQQYLVPHFSRVNPGIFWVPSPTAHSAFAKQLFPSTTLTSAGGGHHHSSI